jgi:hypothetical protein
MQSRCPLLSHSLGDFLVEQPYLQQQCSDQFDAFFLQHNNLFPFVSELMDLLLNGENQSQADQPNSLAGGFLM